MLNGVASDTHDARVAWVMPFLARSHYFQPVFKEFARQFPDTTVFTGEWPGYLPGYETAFRLQLLEGVRFVSVEADPMGYGKGYIWAPPNIIGKLLRFRPGVVIVGGFNLWAVYAAILKLFLRYRMVLFWDGNSPGTVFERNRARVWIRKWLGRSMDACISNTVPGVEYLQRGVGIPAGKIFQAPFQVPAPEVLNMNPVNLQKLEDVRRPMFLYVGRLLKGKGIHKLLEACHLLIERGMDQFSVVLVGDGADAGEFKRQASELGLDRNVHWMGAHAYEQLGSFYATCDIFVLPSLEDCRPMVVSEAMSFGKPILCSRYTDLTDIVHHGENGFIFDAQKPDEIAGYMARLLEQPELIAAQGARSREIIAPFNPRQAAESLAKAVLQALESRAGSVNGRA
jgi:glycosyltransferase involved in cell wall biosynthesis